MLQTVRHPCKPACGGFAMFKSCFTVGPDAKSSNTTGSVPLIVLLKMWVLTITTCPTSAGEEYYSRWG